MPSTDVPPAKIGDCRPGPDPAAWRGRLRNYYFLVRLHRPIGTFLLMWPALWALWLAGQGHPPWPVVLIFVLGVVLMRSAGCAINDFADRHFDGRVARTNQRPLATGAVSPAEAVGVFVVLSLLAFALVLLLDWRTVALKHPGLPLILTSAMDHAIGQMFAAYEAATAKTEIGDRIDLCGLCTQHLFEPDGFFERLKSPGGHLLPDLHGGGLGFGDLLERLPWQRLPSC